MNVLITGGAGYVGTELLARLALNKEITKITIYDNLSRGHRSLFLGKKVPFLSKIEFVHGEILDSRLLKKKLIDTDVLIHLAAIVTTPFANTDPHFYEQVNHWGTAEVVYAAEESGVSKFIHLSSTAVYGTGADLADESTLPLPQTYYGISKLRGEAHVNRLMEKKNAIILRGGNIYGFSKSMRFDAVINKFMFDAHFTNRIQIFGNGKQTRAFIHVAHIVNTLEQCILKEIPTGTYNLVDKNLQILDILDVLKELYPDLEFIYANQHMKLRELNVSLDSKIFDYVNGFPSTSLSDELQLFKSQFAF
jgi:UDP-glucose 4-epimerase|tara:strand:- start:6 stop:926 length:921 start_codon:yes stop_codon:yes gene_type:complete